MSPLNLYTSHQDAPAPLRITEIHPLRTGKPLFLPLLRWRVCAGFPSPAADFTDEPLNLDELTVKRIRRRGRRLALVADAPPGDFPPIEITDGFELEVWGVVTYVVTSLR